MLNKNCSQSQKGSITVIVGIVVLVIILGFVGITVFLNNNKVKVNPVTNKPVITTETSELKTVMTNVEALYSGTLPWDKVTEKPPYKLFTLEIKGLTLATNEVSTNHDNNYSPITSITLGGNSVPVKNSYVSFYEIPDVLNGKFNLKENEIVFPIQLKLYEFDRKLVDNEKSVIKDGTFFKCTNEKATVKQDSLLSDKIIMHSCKLNLTDDQKKQVAGKGFFDEVTSIYLVDRNVLVEMSFDSSYLSNSQEYLQDYLSKLFNTNDKLFVTSEQVRTIEDSRTFEEWRHKTFDK